MRGRSGLREEEPIVVGVKESIRIRLRVETEENKEAIQ